MRIFVTALISLVLAGQALGAPLQDIVAKLDGTDYLVRSTCKDLGTDKLYLGDPEDTEFRVFMLFTANSVNALNITRQCEATGQLVTPLTVRKNPGGTLDIRIGDVPENGDGVEALPLAVFAATINAELAKADSVEVAIAKDEQPLLQPIGTVAGASSTTLLFLDKMPPQVALDYLKACYRTCDTATFALQPPQIDKSYFSILIRAIGWLPEGVTAPSGSAERKIGTAVGATKKN